MTYVVTENCIKCKFTDCVDVCPVDCFHEGPDFLVIDPDECIDCTLCEPECPANAIFYEDELPEGQWGFIALNAELSRQWPIITEVKSPLPDADYWNGKEGKLYYLGKSITEEELQAGLVDALMEIRVRSIVLFKKLTNLQIEAAINDSTFEVRLALVNRHDITLSDAKIERLLTDCEVNIRIAMAKRKDFTLNTAQIERTLIDPSAEIQLVYLMRDDCNLTSEQFARGLKNENSNVRLAYLKRNAYTLNPDQIEDCLKDTFSLVREAIAKRIDFKLNLIQIERGLSDMDADVQVAFLKRGDIEFTTEQFDRGLKSDDYRVSGFFKAMVSNNSNSIFQKHALTNKDPSIRKLSVSYFSEKFTQEQIKIGLLDPDDNVRIAYLNREECLINEQLLESSLKGNSAQFCLSCLNKYTNPFTEQQIEVGLTNPNNEIRKYFASNITFKLSELQVIELLKDKFVDVKLAVISRSDFHSTPENTAICLLDKSAAVRVAIAQKNDFNPSSEQIILGLSNKSDKVKLSFLKCIKTPIKNLNLLIKLGSQYGGISIDSSQLEGNLPGNLLVELYEVNYRLTKNITPANIVFGIHKVTKGGVGACVLLQSSCDNGAYVYFGQGTKTALVFIVHTPKGIRIRIRQAKSGATPASWNELRGFPNGKVTEKLEKWTNATDGYLIPIDEAQTMPEGDSACHIDEWVF